MVGSKSKYFFFKNKKKAQSTPNSTSRVSPVSASTKQKSITSFFRKTSEDVQEQNQEPACKRIRRDGDQIRLSDYRRDAPDRDVGVSNTFIPTQIIDKNPIAEESSTADDPDAPKSSSVKSSAPTPLEKQVIEFKAKYSDMILLVECGYRYRLFGNDAIVASKVLGIQHHQDRMFLTASVPTLKGPGYYVKKLVSVGHKVGIISQTQTAAAKMASGESSSALFSRALTSVYTRTTFLDENINIHVAEEFASNCSNNITSMVLSIMESGARIGMCAIQPTSGQLQFDEFEDDSSRCDLIHRLNMVQPLEIVLPNNVSSITKKAVDFYIASDAQDHIRLEEVEPHKFCLESKDGQKIPVTLNDAPLAQQCIAALYNWLSTFKMESVLLRTSNITRLSNLRPDTMFLPLLTLRNLEMFQTHSSTNKLKGTLYHVLNKTRTKPGARMLKDWIAAPLMNKDKILKRQDCVSYMVSSRGQDIAAFCNHIKKVPDMEVLLLSTLYKRIKPNDFFRMCQHFDKISQSLLEIPDYKRKEMPPLLMEILENIETSFASVAKETSNLNKFVNLNDSFTNLFLDWSLYPPVERRMNEIAELKEKIEAHKAHIRDTLKLYSFNYSSVSGMDYLIEVKQNKVGPCVPADWKKINSTKQVARYRTPYLVEKVPQLQYTEECLEDQCRQCWLNFLDQFSTRNFSHLQFGIQNLSEFDCLISLADISRMEGFCRPTFDCNHTMDIEDGRNIVLEHLMPVGKQYVPNDVQLSRDTGPLAMILTGPNMGGKSSYLRQVAIIVLMAQLGCYVPALKAKLPIFDTILMRIGARDDIFNRRSTFMVELEEASNIVRRASPRSLVLLDELGRGTGTVDGCAIAKSVLKYLVTKVRCFTLFVTHYPQIAALETDFKTQIGNFHMTFCEGDETGNVLFLFKLCKGISSSSFGINVAKMAGVPESVLKLAIAKSKQIESDLNVKV